MTLEVLRKSLVTDSLKGFFTEGESNCAVIEIKLPKSCDGIDLGGYDFEIQGSVNDSILCGQALLKTAFDEKITLSWNVSKDFTAYAGIVSLQLIGKNSDSVIKFPGTEDILIKPKLKGSSPVEVKEISYTNVGDIKLSACAAAPFGWAICDGRELSRSTFAKLFSAIGTLYGAGDWTSTFNIPDLKGRSAVGTDSSDTDFSVCGKYGGEKAHALTADENGPHYHEFASFDQQPGGYLGMSDPDEMCSYSAMQTLESGLGAPHNNLSPYLCLNYIIFTGVGE